MSDVIKLLPDSVANQIAAGEVIQRPASVIKELVENAIDAQATVVQIVLKDAGRTLIQIIDNGVGMSDTDARLAFERHSTSKIRTADDLFSLHTMGFRGEALASIAAISQIELRTRRADTPLGTKLIISASQCLSQEPDACPMGSNFMVKNLFFNVPARRKFLKSNQVELSNIIREFEKLALVNNQVEFTLVHNSSVIYRLSPGTFIQRIAALMGRNIEEQLIPIDINTSLVRVKGYVGRPENARKRNFLQYMFANERFMKHPYFHKAIMSGYEQLIPTGEQPNYFLRITVDPQSLDVNIHPTKTEIKFEDEIPIWQILAAGVKEALGRFGKVPAIDFDTEGAPKIPAYTADAGHTMPKIDVDPNYNPFNQGRATHSRSAVMPNWEELYKNFEKNRQDHTEDTPPLEEFTDMVEHNEPGQENTLLPQADFSTTCLQLKGRYIITPCKTGLMLIDQHRAHVRILFDRYISRLNKGNVSSQSILFPEIMRLSKPQAIELQEILPHMEQMGFSLSDMGQGDWAVNAVPTGLEDVDVKSMVLQIIDSVQNGGASVKSKVMEHISLTMASSAAIPYGRTLLQEEMDILVADLLKLSQPHYTPDGKTVISVIPHEQISKMF